MTLLGALVACAGCNGASPAAGAARSAAPPGPSVQAPGARVAGHWRWSLVTEEDGVRQVERERWHLEPRGEGVAGEYVREVTFLSVDGTPFTCNQDLHYTVTSEYRLEGTIRGDDLELREVDYAVRPSPCDRGFRKLGAYRGELTGTTLVLRWDAGEQTLARAAEPQPRASGSPSGARGAWEWTTRSRDDRDGTSRVEREIWALQENERGRLHGTYERQVTVFSDDGHPFECNGAPSYTYRDRYTVRGRRAGARLSITETRVDAEDHACTAPRTDRHLDHATGEVVGDYLVLDWRGRRRQVLRRPDTDREPAVADHR